MLRSLSGGVRVGFAPPQGKCYFFYALCGSHYFHCFPVGDFRTIFLSVGGSKPASNRSAFCSVFASRDPNVLLKRGGAVFGCMPCLPLPACAGALRCMGSMPWLTPAQHLLAIVRLVVWPVVFQKRLRFILPPLVFCEGLRQAGV